MDAPVADGLVDGVGGRLAQVGVKHDLPGPAPGASCLSPRRRSRACAIAVVCRQPDSCHSCCGRADPRKSPGAVGSATANFGAGGPLLGNDGPVPNLGVGLHLVVEGGEPLCY